MKFRTGFALIAVMLLFAAGSFATSFDLTIDKCTGGCGTPPFGTVTLTDVGANQVQVQVDLADPNEFVATGFPGSFGFNIDGAPTISVSFVNPPSNPSDWSLVSTQSGALQFDGFGNFMYAIFCDSCGKGASNPNPGPLEFIVTAPGLTASSFEVLSGVPPGDTQVFFVADIIGATGLTGPVGGGESGGGPGVPEPTSLLLLGSGLVALALAASRRKR